MIDTPTILQSAETPIALIHITVPREEIQAVMGPGYAELMGALQAQGVAPAGPWLTHHLRMSPEVFDFELAVPVRGTVQPVGRVRMGTLPARTLARTTYRGPFEGLPDAWDAFMAWVTAAGHTPAADLWEVYVRGPEASADPAEWETQLNRPLLHAAD
ncbi:MAG: GyrI-like domain-containing protein [Thermoflexales bacterium]|nr:GyrI-like domain-containing protein [Thermoflexales bacterium]